MSVDIAAIEGWKLDGTVKGFPGGRGALALGEVGRQGWNLLAEDLPLPACVLRQSALEKNEAWMRGFLAANGALIAPHGKTTMAPQLFKRQTDDGAWAITVGSIQQLQVARAFGFPRIVLANQLIGKQAYRFVLDEIARDASFEFFCLVDSVAIVERMAAAARERRPGRPIGVFLEGGMAGKRTGVRDLETARAVARAVKAAEPHLVLRGVEGFEGLVGGPEGTLLVERFLDFLVAMARMVDAENLCAPGKLILTAGGSAFYDMVAKKFRGAGLKRETLLLTRSGCYITHDSLLYAKHLEGILERSPELGALGLPEAALEVWAYVQSRPEPTRALVTMGARDTYPGGQMPVPLKWYRPGSNTRAPQKIPAGHSCVAMNDQHGYLDVPADSPLAVGDMVGFGIAHPCLTFDRWQFIAVVDDSYGVTGGIRTFF